MPSSSGSGEIASSAYEVFKTACLNHAHDMNTKIRSYSTLDPSSRPAGHAHCLLCAALKGEAPFPLARFGPTWRAFPLLLFQYRYRYPYLYAVGAASRKSRPP
ncbi:hypothetical protein XENOCAPTIV_000878 [Xenoophorus captivus]|uniref:Uncharacterized protein n=1 Tax=Xenoophorus captivus TaxID=1517983 RepID=A0ABV0RMZ6_9TELE